jgi:hypothetical protein
LIRTFFADVSLYTVDNHGTFDLEVGYDSIRIIDIEGVQNFINDFSGRFFPDLVDKPYYHDFPSFILNATNTKADLIEVFSNKAYLRLRMKIL